MVEWYLMVSTLQQIFSICEAKPIAILKALVTFFVWFSSQCFPSAYRRDWLKSILSFVCFIFQRHIAQWNYVQGFEETYSCTEAWFHLLSHQRFAEWRHSQAGAIFPVVIIFNPSTIWNTLLRCDIVRYSWPGAYIDRRALTGWKVIFAVSFSST